MSNLIRKGIYFYEISFLVNFTKVLKILSCSLCYKRKSDFKSYFLKKSLNGVIMSNILEKYCIFHVIWIFIELAVLLPSRTRMTKQSNVTSFLSTNIKLLNYYSCWKWKSIRKLWFFYYPCLAMVAIWCKILTTVK